MTYNPEEQLTISSLIMLTFIKQDLISFKTDDLSHLSAECEDKSILEQSTLVTDPRCKRLNIVNTQTSFFTFIFHI